ncbi:glycosyltransferase [Peribacillus muralis]|uniref:glycosyltransferase n=1 Tax=Peribacillus muralis TaxID=264697 RepID=UPI003D072F5C
MIFVTLGTQNFAMNRLIDEIDRLIENGVLKPENLIIQRGVSKSSKYAKSMEMVQEKDFERILVDAECIICHGGTSSIIKALKSSKKVIAIPRRAKYKEHVDDHQLEIVEVFYSQGYIEKLDNIKNLEVVLEEIKKKEYKKYTQTGELAKKIVVSVLESKL